MKTWKHGEITDEEMKLLVKDVFDAKIFTSLHLDQHSSYLIGSVFMPVMFIAAPPSEPNFPDKTGDIKKDRKNKLNYLDAVEQWKKDYKEWEDETPLRNAYMEDIGMIYEYNEKALPRSINGYPIFMSCNIVSKADTKKFLEVYKKYEDARTEFEKNFPV